MIHSERPAKAAGRPSRFMAQDLRSEASPKKWGLLLLHAPRFFRTEKNNPLAPDKERREGCGQPISSEQSWPPAATADENCGGLE
jgi:hypothetical protein